MRAYKQFEREISCIQIPNHEGDLDRVLEETKVHIFNEFLKDFDVDQNILD
jgi:hypothetical protein